MCFSVSKYHVFIPESHAYPLTLTRSEVVGYYQHLAYRVNGCYSDAHHRR
jgi:hypothetical protein